MFRLIAAMFALTFSAMFETDGGGEGDSGESGATNEGGAETQPAQNTGETSDAGNTPPNEGETPTAKYTDKDLDHHKGKARTETRSSILSKLGFEKIEDAVSWVQERRTGEKTAEETANSVLQTANNRIIRSEAKDIAATLGVRPNRVQTVIGMADLGEIEVDGNGEVTDPEALKNALSAVTTEYPEFTKAFTGKNPGEKETPGAPTGIDAEIQEALEKGDYRKMEQLQRRKLAVSVGRIRT